MSPTNHDVWDAVEPTDGTPANSFEMLVAVQPLAGGAYVQSADITNLNPAFAPKNRMRETYAVKGSDLATKYADTLSLTFDVELVRDANGAFQPFAQDLIDASKAIGAANKRRIQFYDALGGDYAYEAQYAINVTRSGTGFDEAAFMTVTAVRSAPGEWIDNPVLVGLVPLLTSALPTAAEAGDTLFIQGVNFTGTTGATGVTIGGVNATSYVVVNDTLITAVVPAGSAGSAPVIVTSPEGASAPLPYVRG